MGPEGGPMSDWGRMMTSVAVHSGVIVFLIALAVTFLIALLVPLVHLVRSI